MNWQPIETAPRLVLTMDKHQPLDEVLVYNSETGEMAYGAVHDFKSIGALDDGTPGVAGLGVIKGVATVFIATHWCRPDPPK